MRIRLASLSILFVTIFLVLISTAFATVIEQKIGPYDVTFDLTNTSTEVNSSANYWNEEVTEGAVFIVKKDLPGKFVARIWILRSESGIVVDQAEYANALRHAGLKNIETYTRTIDGERAILTTGEFQNGGLVYWANYKLNPYTLVDIRSYMPMDKGTGDLLNTIHVMDRIAL